MNFGSTVLNMQKHVVLTRRQFYATVTSIAVISFLVSLWINRTTWFISDDFAFLTYRYFEFVDGDKLHAILTPHNDHLMALPILMFVSLQYFFGLNNHLIFMVPSIIINIAIMFAVAIILRKRCKSDLSSFAAVCCVAFMSRGCEVLMMATNIGFITTICIALFQLILVDHDGATSKRDYVASLLGVVAILCSGASIPFLAMVVLFLILKHEIKRSIFIAGPAAVLYMLWFFAFGTLTHSAAGPLQYPPFTMKVQTFQFVIDGLRESLSVITHVGGSSTFLIIICFLGLNKKNTKVSTILMPICLAIGGVAFFFITAYSRVTFGNATSGRYIYVGAVLFVPLIFIGIEQLFESISTYQVFALVTCMWLSITGIFGVLSATETSPYTDPVRIQTLFAARDLVVNGSAPVSGTPSPTYDPDLTYDWIRRLVNNDMWNK